MSKDIRSIGTQLKAPKKLVEAAQTGERLAPRLRKFDTASTHFRRFAIALAGYACVAALLIYAGFGLLPSQLNDDPPVTQPIVDSGDFIRSDLLWSDETNGLNRRILYRFYTECDTDGKRTSNEYFNLPAYPDDTVYAVKVYANDETTIERGSRRTEPPESILTFLSESEGWECFTGPYDEICFAVTADAFESLDTDRLLELLEEEGILTNDPHTSETQSKGELLVLMAWQSPNGVFDPQRNGNPYCYITPDTPYIRPDLVWANELNRDSTRYPLWELSRELVPYTDTAETQFEICSTYFKVPAFDHYPSYALTFELNFYGASVSESDYTALCDKIFAYPGWKAVEGFDYVWEVSFDDAKAMEEPDAIREWTDYIAREINKIDKDCECSFEIRFAWQSIDS